ncbi:MAG: hypothetical protein O9262_09870 [Cyclobacteriaceae bacterium]|nr:hypothetical protein [Cyclobacteriaceae bacterium]
MKKIILPILTVVMLIVSCRQEDTEQKKDDTLPTTRKAVYAVSKEEAEAGNASYVKLMQQLDSTNMDPVRAFTVRSVDFLQLLNIDTTMLTKEYHSHIRIYLGYENGSTKLYFTPVTGAKLSGDNVSAGTDLFWDGPFEGELNRELASETGEYLFDFTKPCPTTCPEIGF